MYVKVTKTQFLSLSFPSPSVLKDVVSARPLITLLPGNENALFSFRRLPKGRRSTDLHNMLH